MLAEHRLGQFKRIEIVTNVRLPFDDNSKLHATPWNETTDGTLLRILYIPTGMTEEEARRIVESSRERDLSA